MNHHKKYKKMDASKKHEQKEVKQPEAIISEIIRDAEIIVPKEPIVEETSSDTKTFSTPAKETPSLSVPIAIIIAGILVAGSILYTGSKTPAVPKDANYTAVASLLKKGTISAEVGLDKKKFNACLESGKYAQAISDSVDGGTKAGVNGTPFPIVVTKTGTKFVFDGRTSIEDLIANALAGKTTGAVSIDIPAISEKDHILGSRDAEVFIVEYSDTECPYSKMFHQTMIDLMKNYKDGKKVAWVYRHFPLDMHPKARKEAEATECAMEQGGQAKFWEYIDLMFKVAPSNNKLDLTLL